jgi:hypothetical protein
MPQIIAKKSGGDPTSSVLVAEQLHMLGKQIRIADSEGFEMEVKFSARPLVLLEDGGNKVYTIERRGQHTHVQLGPLPDRRMGAARQIAKDLVQEEMVVAVLNARP